VAVNIPDAGASEPRKSSAGLVVRLVESTGVRLLLSLLLWGWVALSSVVLSLLALVLLVPFNPWVDPRRRVLDFFNQLWGKGILRVLPGIPVEVVGRERLREHPGPFVFCPNHQSVADIPLLLAVLPPFKFIAKAPLFFIPLFGLQLRVTGHIMAARGEAGGAERVLAQAETWLRRGTSILVFPEGTRTPDGRVLRFGQGPFALAQHAGVPVVPISISGTRRIIPKGGFLYRFVGHVRVELHEPLRVEGDPKKAASRVRALVQETVERGQETSHPGPAEP
jgi:1-acyl-sn-glycerol-3-phosphate acyltransferase